MADPGFESLPQNATAGSTAYPRSPDQALRLTRLISLSLLSIPAMLTFVAWFLTSHDPTAPAGASLTDPKWYGLLALGVSVAILAPSISGRMGRNAARRWAATGVGRDRVATPQRGQAAATIPGLDVGSAATVTPAPTLWDQFSSISIVGCALPEMSLLMAFVATFMTERVFFILAAIPVYFVFWAASFPRRSTWDDWASSAGLVLPWSDSVPGLSDSPRP